MICPKNTNVSLFLALIVLTFLAGDVTAQGESADEVYSFAGQLKRDRLFEAAAQQFLKFATGNPQDPRAPDALEQAADCLMRSGARDEAIHVLETLISTYEDSADLCGPKVRLGNLYYNKERFADADRMYSDVVAFMRDCPLYPNALLGKGEALIPLQKFNAAADLFRTVIQHHLESQVAPRAFFDLAFCQRRLGQNPKALETYAELVRVFPKNPLSAFASIEAAKLYVESGDSLTAVKQYEMARKFEEKALFVPATLGGALILERIGEHERALAWYREIIELDDLGDSEEDPAELYGRAARAAYHTGSYDLVFRFSERFAEKYGTAFSPGVVYYEAMTELKRSNHLRAIEHAGRLEALASGTEWAVLAARIRGRALHASGKPREAIGELRRFVSSTPDSIAKNNILGEIADILLTALADTSAALDVLQEKLEIQKRRYPSDIFQTAWVFEKARKYREAVELYREILDGFPLAPEAEAAETRLTFIQEFTLLDPSDALASLDRIALEITSMERSAALLKLAETRLEVIKDPDGALKILSDLKSSLASSPLFPKVLYLEGLCHASRSRRASLFGDDKTARDASKRTADSWDTLQQRYAGTEWAARAATDKILFEVAVSGEVDTSAVYQTLSRYPKHPGRAALLELLGDYYSKTGGGTETALSRALVYYRQAVTLTRDRKTSELELKIADTLFPLGREKEALDLYESLAEEGDKSIRFRAVYGAGKALRKLKRYEDALSRFVDVGRNAGGNMSAKSYIQAADCFYLLKRYEEALTAYHHVETITSDSNLLWEARFRTGLCQRRLGRLREALKVMEACITSPIAGTIRNRAYTQAMEITRELGDAQGEKRLLTAFVEASPGGELAVSARRRLVKLHLSIDESASALALAERLAGRKNEPDDEDIALWVMSLYRTGKVEEAKTRRAALEEKVEAGSPFLGEIAIEEAKYYYGEKDFQNATRAVAGLAKACMGDSICEEALYMHSMSLIAQDKVEEGTQEAQRFFERFPLSPHVPRLHLKLGNVLSIKYKRHNEALMHFREAAATAKDSSVVFNALKHTAVTFQTLSSWSEAGQAWGEVLERFPRSPYAKEASLNAARCKMESGDYTGAIKIYEDALPLLDGEDRARAYYWLGICHQTLGDYPSAIVEYLKVPYLLPSEAMWAVTSQLKAAECYTAIERFDAAREVYSSVIDQYGASSNWGKVAQEALEALKGEQPKGQKGGTGEE